MVPFGGFLHHRESPGRSVRKLPTELGCSLPGDGTHTAAAVVDDGTVDRTRRQVAAPVPHGTCYRGTERALVDVSSTPKRRPGALRGSHSSGTATLRGNGVGSSCRVAEAAVVGVNEEGSVGAEHTLGGYMTLQGDGRVARATFETKLSAGRTISPRVS